MMFHLGITMWLFYVIQDASVPDWIINAQGQGPHFLLLPQSEDRRDLG